MEPLKGNVMLEIVIAVIVGGVIGFLIARNTWRVTEWNQRRLWKNAGVRWTVLFDKATRATESYRNAVAEMSPDDPFIQGIREETLPSNALSPCEQMEAEERIKAAEQKVKAIEERLKTEKSA